MNSLKYISSLIAFVCFSHSRRLTLFLSLFVGVVGSSAQDISTGLQAHWDFNTPVDNNGTLEFADVSGNGHMMTEAGNVQQIQMIDGAVSMPTKNDFLATPNFDIFNGNGGTELSVFTWVNPESFSTTLDMFVSNWYNLENRRSFGLGCDSEGKFKVWLSADGGSTNFGQFVTDGSLSEDVWSFVGFTFSNGDLKLYVNGEEVEFIQIKGNSFTALYLNTVNPVELGTWNSAGENYTSLGLQLDETRIYSRALSEYDVKEIYRLNPNIPDTFSDLVAHWDFNTAVDNNGTLEFADVSGNGNTATVVGEANNSVSFDVNALSLDGVDDYLEVAPLDVFDGNGGTELSVFTWVKLDNLPNAHKVIMGIWDMVNGKSWGIGTDAESNLRLYFSESGNSAVQYKSSSFVFETDRFYHIGFTYQNGVSTAYVNGSVVGMTLDYGTPTNNLKVTNLPVFIGNYNSSNSSPTYFEGSLDESYIYSRALSSTDVQALYHENCIVSNTLDDTNPGSFRYAVETCANGSTQDAKVSFAVSGDINLGSPVIVNNSNKASVLITGKDDVNLLGSTSYDGLVLSSSNVSVEDLNLQDFDKAISSTADNVVLNNLTIEDANEAISISAGSNVQVTNSTITDPINRGVSVVNTDNVKIYKSNTIKRTITHSSTANAIYVENSSNVNIGPDPSIPEDIEELGNTIHGTFEVGINTVGNCENLKINRNEIGGYIMDDACTLLEDYPDFNNGIIAASGAVIGSEIEGWHNYVYGAGRSNVTGDPAIIQNNIIGKNKDYCIYYPGRDPVGISLKNTTLRTEIKDNIFGNSSKAVYVAYSGPGMWIHGNNIGYDEVQGRLDVHSGVWFFKDAEFSNTLIEDNVFHASANNILLEQGNREELIVRNNEIGVIGQSFISRGVQVRQNGGLFENNTIYGASNYGFQFAYGAGDALLNANVIKNSTVAISLDDDQSQNITISENVFKGNTSTIILPEGANASVQTVDINNVTPSLTTEGNVLLSGVNATEGEIIEVFLSDNDPDHENATKFLGAATVQPGGTWSLEISKFEFSPDEPNYIRTTVTDVAGNTSELSAAKQIDDVTGFTACTVTKLTDNGANDYSLAEDGELRYELKTCAVNATEDVVVNFDVEGEIVLGNQIGVTKLDGYKINIVGKGDLLKISGATDITGIQITNQGASVRDLYFDGFNNILRFNTGGFVKGNRFENSIISAVYGFTANGLIIESNQFHNNKRRGVWLNGSSNCKIFNGNSFTNDFDPCTRCERRGIQINNGSDNIVGPDPENPDDLEAEGNIFFGSYTQALYSRTSENLRVNKNEIGAYRMERQGDVCEFVELYSKANRGGSGMEILGGNPQIGDLDLNWSNWVYGFYESVVINTGTFENNYIGIDPNGCYREDKLDNRSGIDIRGSTSDLKIRGNVFGNQSSAILAKASSQNVTIEDNYFGYHPELGSIHNFSGISFYLQHNHDNYTIRNNVFANNTRWAMHLRSKTFAGLDIVDNQFGIEVDGKILSNGTAISGGAPYSVSGNTFLGNGIAVQFHGNKSGGITKVARNTFKNNAKSIEADAGMLAQGEYVIPKMSF